MGPNLQESGVVISAVAEGLTGEVDALQPRCLLWTLAAGNRQRGNFPAVPAAPGLDHISHNAQNPTPPTPPPGPLSLSASVSSPPLCVLFPSLFLPSPLCAFWRYTHTLSEACSSWPLLHRHFLCRLWRPKFGLINAAFFLFKKNSTINKKMKHHSFANTTTKHSSFKKFFHTKPTFLDVLVCIITLWFRRCPLNQNDAVLLEARGTRLFHQSNSRAIVGASFLLLYISRLDWQETYSGVAFAPVPLYEAVKGGWIQSFEERVQAGFLCSTR